MQDAQKPQKTRFNALDKVLLSFLCLLAIAYLIQMRSPLRVSGDSPDYLNMAISFRAGNGFLVGGRSLRFPVGYPLLIAGLDALGVACSTTFILLNDLSIAIGLWCSAILMMRVFGYRLRATLVMSCLTLLCFVLVKTATLMLSDCLFFGLSLACITLLSNAATVGNWRRWVFLTTGFGMVGAAMLVRTVGITLLPAAATAAWFAGRDIWPKVAFRGKRFLIALVIIAAVTTGVFIITRTGYFNLMADVYAHEPLGRIFAYNLYDWGELLLNIPQPHLPSVLHPLIPLAGALFGIAFVLALWQRRRLDPVTVYALCYFGIIAAWPYRDPRFWLPMLPLFLAYIGLIFKKLERIPFVRMMKYVYLLGFTAIGILALTYHTWISWSGDDFPNRYGLLDYRMSYRAAFGVKPVDPDQINPQIVRLLNRLEPRAGNTLENPKGRSPQTK